MRTFSESAILLLIARYGSSMPLWRTQLVKRARAWAAELAWTVESVPEWPVLSNWSRSNASPPRISPRMMRAGRCLKANEIGLFQLNFGRVLDEEDAIFIADEPGN